jgi:hypothetical protein
MVQVSLLCDRCGVRVPRRGGDYCSECEDALSMELMDELYDGYDMEHVVDGFAASSASEGATEAA